MIVKINTAMGRTWPGCVLYENAILHTFAAYGYPVPKKRRAITKGERNLSGGRSFTATGCPGTIRACSVVAGKYLKSFKLYTSPTNFGLRDSKIRMAYEVHIVDSGLSESHSKEFIKCSTLFSGGYFLEYTSCSVHCHTPLLLIHAVHCLGNSNPS